MEKKWDFTPADSGLWGCVGCGRCIEACAGGIDIRETLRDLAHA
jgi:heterodisulfide reductase subunit C